MFLPSDIQPSNRINITPIDIPEVMALVPGYCRLVSRVVLIEFPVCVPMSVLAFIHLRCRVQDIYTKL
jgi:hypothetical protein